MGYWKVEEMTKERGVSIYRHFINGFTLTAASGALLSTLPSKKCLTILIMAALSVKDSSSMYWRSFWWAGGGK
jgi:hypothetical protein